MKLLKGKVVNANHTFIILTILFSLPCVVIAFSCRGSSGGSTGEPFDWYCRNAFLHINITGTLGSCLILFARLHCSRATTRIYRLGTKLGFDALRIWTVAKDGCFHSSHVLRAFPTFHVIS